MHASEDPTPVLRAIGDLVDGIGSTHFGERFFGLFNELVSIDHCSVFAIEGDEEPQTLIAEAGDPARRLLAQRLAQDYVSGAFIDDPFLVPTRDDILLPEHHSIVSAFSPREMLRSDYRRRFYDEPEINHEVNVVEHVGGIRLYACLYRTTQPSFSDSEVAAVKRYASLGMKALRRHIALSDKDVGPVARLDSLSVGQRDRLLAQIRDDLFSSREVSPREADVCAHIALGYSINAISMIMGITPNTASTHRKRAYYKLGICSQNELFARYVDFARNVGH